VEIAAQFPEQPCEPWHAVFRGSTASLSNLVHSARTYGNHIVEIGFEADYMLISIHASEEEIYVHCIPYSGCKYMVDYLKKLYA
jgi:hypothetical protein